MPQTNKITALYCRLSQEDLRLGESESIQNQKMILERYAKEHHFANIRFFVDDGISGVSFERDGLQAMLDEVEAGNVATVITKDLSRLGRNYLKTGELIEITFPENNVRYIAINDNVDTASGDNEFTPLRNWVNEFYARDTSKKIRAVKHEKAMRGERVNGEYPYGYLPDPDNRNHLIPDPETAHVVKKIFEMYVSGARFADIQDWLRENKICTISELRHRRGSNCHYPRPHPDCVYNWATLSIERILSAREYTGTLVTNKTTRVSYKIKRMKINGDDERFFFPNAHEPLVDKETFELAQKRLATRNRPVKREKKIDLFSGLMFCGDCGGKMYTLHCSEDSRRNGYTCGNYRNQKRVAQLSRCTIHFVLQRIVIELVLEDLKRVISLVNENEREFVAGMCKNAEATAKKGAAKAKRELEKAEKRVFELDTLFRKSYEDNALGKITDEQFSFLTCGFDEEKSMLENRIVELKKEIDLPTERNDDVKKFVSCVKKYADLSDLNYENVHALIDRILIYDTSENGARKIEIYYRYIGKIPNNGSPIEVEYLTPRAQLMRVFLG